MKQKGLNSLRQNIKNKISTLNTKNKEKNIISNLYPYTLPIKYNDISNKNDELLMKKKIFNYSNNSKYITLGSSYLSSLKSLNKNKINLKNHNLFGVPKENSINASKNNGTTTKSIDNSINNSKDLINNNENIKLNNLFNNNFFNNKAKKDNLSLNKIIKNKEEISFFGSTANKINLNNLELNLFKKKENSISGLNNRKNSAEKKTILLKKNVINNDINSNENKLIKNVLKESPNYRKYLFNEKKLNKIKAIDILDNNEKEIMEVINDNKTKNKGLFYLYNYQNLISNQSKKIKSSIKYPSFNTINRKGINNSNLYNISNENKSNYQNKPMLILAPSINNNLNDNKKEKRIKEYNYLFDKNDNNIFDMVYDKSNTNYNQNEENNNNKINITNKKIKNINHIKIFSQNNTVKNWNNNINNLNLNNISNLSYKLNNIKKKLKLKKAISSNKTECLLNNKNELDEFNELIEKYIAPSYSAKDSKKSNNNNNDNIKFQINDKITIPKENSIDLNIDKKRSKTISMDSNNIKISKKVEKKENSLDNISETSKASTILKSSKYYMDKSNKLVSYIKKYYNEHKTYPETKINFYLYGRQIGQGAFGKVNLGLNVLTGRVVAIKSFKSSEEKFKSNMKKILYETNLMKRLNHPNITKILEVFHDEGYMLIIMEYINGGNLFSFVKKRRKLSEKTAKFLFRQIIQGIKYIHSQNIVHRDIKLENIIIDFNNNVKICDFGIGKILKHSDELINEKCGTPMYMAPEIILSNNSKAYKGFPIDIWASGITLYIMLTGSLPYNISDKSKEEFSLKKMKKKNHTDLQFQIINFNLKKIKKISDEANNLLSGLLNKNPDKRLTCDEILNHPWLQDNNLNSLDNNKYHLFTKAEMKMMSKTYIDYRNGGIEDLRENFTITNLKSDEIKKEEKNINTKSTILDPFNSAINKNTSLNNSGIKEDSFDDFNNSNLKLENDLIIFKNKVKEFNINYEINNNQEVDNGMLIKTKSDISSTTSKKSNSYISHNDSVKNNKVENEDSNNSKNIEENDNNKNNLLSDGYIGDTNIRNNLFDINNTNDEKILHEMENFGFKKEYIIKCLKENILCHASTVYYLLKNYGNIE